MADVGETRGPAERSTVHAQPSDGTYVLAASAAEHARLIELARGAAPTVREMCARAGVGAGARVVDVGCGPVGALLELAEITGPRGTVVGVDSSAAAVETARAIVAEQDLGTVRVVHGDVNTMDLAAVAADGPFDAAHLRLVLVHQADPAATLRRVATLLQPGGTVLASEFRDYPRHDPPVPACERAWELMFAAAWARGVARDVGFRLPRLCAEAGLRVLDARGAFDVLAPARAGLAGTRALLLAALTAAEAQEFRSFTNGLSVQVIAAVPQGE